MGKNNGTFILNKIHSVNSFKGEFTLTGATSKVLIKSRSWSWVESLRVLFLSQRQTRGDPLGSWAFSICHNGNTWPRCGLMAQASGARPLSRPGGPCPVHPTPTSCRLRSFLCFRFAIWMGAGNGWEWTSVFCRVSVYIGTVLSHFTFKCFYHKNNIHWL